MMSPPEMIDISALGAAFDRFSKFTNPDDVKKVLHEIPSVDRDLYHTVFKQYKTEVTGNTPISKIDKRLLTQLDTLLTQVGAQGTNPITSPRDATLNAVHALFLKFWRGLKNCLGLRRSADEFAADIQSHIAVEKRYSKGVRTRNGFWETHFSKNLVPDNTAYQGILSKDVPRSGNVEAFQTLYGTLQEKERNYLDACEGQDDTAKENTKKAFEEAFIYDMSHRILMGVAPNAAIQPQSMNDFHQAYGALTSANPPPTPDQVRFQNNAIDNLFRLYDALGNQAQP